jgi:hypothetical protein
MSYSSSLTGFSCFYKKGTAKASTITSVLYGDVDGVGDPPGWYTVYASTYGVDRNGCAYFNGTASYQNGYFAMNNNASGNGSVYFSLDYVLNSSFTLKLHNNYGATIYYVVVRNMVPSAGTW